MFDENTFKSKLLKLGYSPEGAQILWLYFNKCGLCFNEDIITINQLPIIENSESDLMQKNGWELQYDPFWVIDNKGFEHVDVAQAIRSNGVLYGSYPAGLSTVYLYSINN